VLAVADRIAVLRRGQIVGERTAGTATEAELAELMVGRPVRFTVERKPARPGEGVLAARQLRVLSDRDEVAVDGIDLSVRAGEVVAIAGVQGNGQTELTEALTGLRRPLSGGVSLLGKDITRATARERHRMGLAHVPEDRQRMGLIGEFDIAENMIL